MIDSEKKTVSLTGRECGHRMLKEFRALRGERTLEGQLAANTRISESFMLEPRLKGNKFCRALLPVPIPEMLAINVASDPEDPASSRGLSAILLAGSHSLEECLLSEIAGLLKSESSTEKETANAGVAPVIKLLRVGKRGDLVRFTIL
ncbi:MAG: hypothetical protein MPN21_18740 [Thermoanaerobaculia bacterium]|nr:hypothetical protein [Thermoanaerobaculia bacterium]